MNDFSKAVDQYYHSEAWFAFYRAKCANKNSNKNEVQGILDLLRPKVGAKILDLCCGQGRIGLELARMGYEITGIDYNEELIKIAQQKAEAEKLSAQFLQMDPVRSPKSLTGFDDVVIAWSTTSLFDQSGLLALLKYAHQSLAEGGQLFFDTLVMETYLKSGFKTETIAEMDGLLYEEHYSLDPKTGAMMQKGLITDKVGAHPFNYEIKLYTVERYIELCQQAGFVSWKIFGNTKGKPYEIGDRLYFMAQK